MNAEHARGTHVIAGYGCPNCRCLEPGSDAKSCDSCGWVHAPDELGHSWTQDHRGTSRHEILGLSTPLCVTCGARKSNRLKRRCPPRARVRWEPIRTAYIEQRAQKAIGTWPKCGPDTYVAVQIVPPGVEPLEALNAKAAENRGIKLIRCGEGYSANQGPLSALGAALCEAYEIASEVNGWLDGIMPGVPPCRELTSWTFPRK